MQQQAQSSRSTTGCHLAATAGATVAAGRGCRSAPKPPCSLCLEHCTSTFTGLRRALVFRKGFDARIQQSITPFHGVGTSRAGITCQRSSSICRGGMYRPRFSTILWFSLRDNYDCGKHSVLPYWAIAPERVQEEKILATHLQLKTSEHQGTSPMTLARCA